MTSVVFWTAIAGPLSSVHEDSNKAHLQAYHLIAIFKHSNAYVYDKDGWHHYTKGVRGNACECEIPEDEVPQVYRLLALLEN